jgi:CheY-like chemotaxis protein
MKPCILLVEDNEVDARAFRLLLDKMSSPPGLQVVGTVLHATCYLKGIEPFSNRSEHPIPFLIVIDWNLPDVGGIELIKWIRTQPDLDPLLLAVMTATKQDANLIKVYSLGAQALLFKGDPIEFQLQAIRDLRQSAIEKGIIKAGE